MWVNEQTIETSASAEVEPAGHGRNRVVYRMEISGRGEAAIAQSLGPALSGDLPNVLAALVARPAS